MLQSVSNPNPQKSLWSASSPLLISSGGFRFRGRRARRFPPPPRLFRAPFPGVYGTNCPHFWWNTYYQLTQRDPKIQNQQIIEYNFNLVIPLFFLELEFEGIDCEFGGLCPPVRTSLNTVTTYFSWSGLWDWFFFLHVSSPTKYVKQY